jgi:hypothetical protein
MWRSLRETIQLHLKTVVALSVVGGLTFTWSLYISQIFPIEFFSTMDVWYGSDIKRVAANMFRRDVWLGRAGAHPIFGLLIFPPTRLLGLQLGPNFLLAIKLVIAFFAATSVVFVFALARVLLKNMFLALLTTLFMLSSATFIFWSAVPESFIFGSAAISATFFFSIAVNLSPRAHVPLHVLTLAFTITNWLAAILASLSQFRISSVMVICLAGLVIVAVLALIQRAIFIDSPLFFLEPTTEWDRHYMSLPSFENIPLYGQRTLNFLFATIVAPEPSINLDRRSFIGNALIQSSLNYSPVGWIGIASWLVIFGAGLVKAFFISSRRQFLIVVGGFSIFQLALHIVYGDEPFLYSMHFLPALVLIGCLSLIGRYRWYFAALMSVAIACNLVNNYGRFVEAVALVPLS